MNNPLKKLQKEAQTIRLSEHERSLMHARLVRTLGLHEPVPSAYVYHYQWLSMRFAVPMAAVLIVMLGGGTAAAAYGALPGDILYPVKISVNERVELAFATTPEKKAETEVRLAGRRVFEAEELDAAGKLDAATTEELERQFDKHAERALALAGEVALARATVAEDASEEESATTMALKVATGVQETETPAVAEAPALDTAITMAMVEVEVATATEEAPAPVADKKVKEVASTTEKETKRKITDKDIRALMEEKKARFEELRTRVFDRDEGRVESVSTSTEEEESTKDEEDKKKDKEEDKNENEEKDSRGRGNDNSRRFHPWR